MKIDIVYEDNHLLVCVKPLFMPSQPDRSGKLDLGTALKQLIKERDRKPGNVYLGQVHRLDQPVSGLMVFAKTSKAAKRLSEQFRLNAIEKYYLAITKGEVSGTPTIWEDYLSTKTKNGRYFVTDEARGKKASLIITNMAHDKKENVSLVHIKLLTGRSHQIRVQCQSRGYPLLGDRRYGDESALDRNTPSIALFASGLAFVHPVKKDQLYFAKTPTTEAFHLFADALSNDSIDRAKRHLDELD